MMLCSECATEEARDKLCHRSLCEDCHYDYHRFQRLMSTFDLSREDYDMMLTGQDGVCAIEGCDRETSHKAAKALAVDHDHRTGLVRGLLCFYHNRLIGQMSPELVAALNVYLQDPPASRHLGREHFTTPGRVGTKRRRKLRRPR